MTNEERLKKIEDRRIRIMKGQAIRSYRCPELITSDVPWLIQRVRELEAALTHIRDKCGKVCEEYEICTHIACRSSYDSWAHADQALIEPQGQSGG